MYIRFKMRNAKFNVSSLKMGPWVQESEVVSNDLQLLFEVVSQLTSKEWRRNKNKNSLKLICEFFCSHRAVISMVHYT